MTCDMSYYPVSQKIVINKYIPLALLLDSLIQENGALLVLVLVTIKDSRLLAFVLLACWLVVAFELVAMSI